MHHKKRVEETRVCISLYRLLTVASRVHGFALITAPVLTFLSTGREAAITMKNVKIDITQ